MSKRGKNKPKPAPRKPSPRKPALYIPPSSPSLPVRHFFWQRLKMDRNSAMAILLICFLVTLTILFLALGPLNEANWLRPHTYAIGQSIEISLVSIATILAGFAIVFRIQHSNIFQGFKRRQAIYAVGSGVFLTIIILALIVQPPPTPTPQRNFVAIPYPPGRGELAFNGMQKSASSKYYWLPQKDAEGSCWYVGSEYHIATNNQKGLEYCQAVNTDFHNFAFEVDMSFVKPGLASILFLATPKVAFELSINSLQYYAQFSLGVISGFNSKQQLHYRGLVDPIPIIARGASLPIDFGIGVINRIGIVVYNQTIDTYINGLTVKNWERTDDSSTHGSIVLGAFAPSDQKSTEIVYSNARAWTL